MHNSRIVALDIGDARIGVAVSDESRIIATPITYIKRIGYSKDIAAIKDICAKYDTSLVLSGLPLNMDGSEGFQAKKVRDLCALLEENGLTVFFQDERLTTVGAENALLESNMHRSDRKTHVDKVAAALILQTYLDKQCENPSDSDTNISESEYENMDGTLNNNDILQFCDDNGNVKSFELICRLDYSGKTYLALLVLDEHGNEPKDDEQAEIVFMEETTTLSNGDDITSGETGYIPVNDAETQDILFAQFMKYIEGTEE